MIQYVTDSGEETVQLLMSNIIPLSAVLISPCGVFMYNKDSKYKCFVPNIRWGGLSDKKFYSTVDYFMEFYVC